MSCPVCYEECELSHTCETCRNGVCDDCFHRLRELKCPMCRSPYEGAEEEENGLPPVMPTLRRLNAVLSEGDDVEEDSVEQVIQVIPSLSLRGRRRRIY